MRRMALCLAKRPLSECSGMWENTIEEELEKSAAHSRSKEP